MYRLGGVTMGTTWSVHLVAAQGLALAPIESLVAEELAQVDAEMSTWRADSAISTYNRAAAGSSHALPPAFERVLREALAIAEASEGAFDPSVGPLVRLWGFGPDGGIERRPDAQAIAAARSRVGWQRLRFDGAGRLPQPGGLELDLSAIAKGYAVDAIADRLLAAGHRNFLVEVGGELRAQGHKPDGHRWRIAIESPLGDGHAPVRVLSVTDSAVATSGEYRNLFIENGRRYSHLIDPRSGEPVRQRLLSVTVLHEQAMAADAWATALHVLGPDAGMDLAQQRGLAVLMLVDEDGAIVALHSPAFPTTIEND